MINKSLIIFLNPAPRAMTSISGRFESVSEILIFRKRAICVAAELRPTTGERGESTARRRDKNARQMEIWYVCFREWRREKKIPAVTELGTRRELRRFSWNFLFWLKLRRCSHLRCGLDRPAAADTSTQVHSETFTRTHSSALLAIARESPHNIYDYDLSLGISQTHEHRALSHRTEVECVHVEKRWEKNNTHIAVWTWRRWGDFRETITSQQRSYTPKSLKTKATEDQGQRARCSNCSTNERFISSHTRVLIVKRSLKLIVIHAEKRSSLRSADSIVALMRQSWAITTQRQVCCRHFSFFGTFHLISRRAQHSSEDQFESLHSVRSKNIKIRRKMTRWCRKKTHREKFDLSFFAHTSAATALVVVTSHVNWIFFHRSLTLSLLFSQLNGGWRSLPLPAHTVATGPTSSFECEIEERGEHENWEIGEFAHTQSSRKCCMANEQKK